MTAMVMGELTQETQVLVIGGGPGGYAAAFRAADLGLEVTMIDMRERPGGECLYQGCIPSKTLLFLAELIHDAKRASSMGLAFGEPQVDLEAMRNWKDQVVDSLADGLVTLSSKRGVQLLHGRAVFEGSDRVRLHDADVSHIRFQHAILATGSYPASFPNVNYSGKGRIMDSAGALELDDIPGSLLVLGGGYIALELGMLYASLGSRVTLVARSERLVRGADADLVSPLIRRIEGMFDGIHYNTEVLSLHEEEKNAAGRFKGSEGEWEQAFDRVLVAIGRTPNSRDIGLETTNVEVNDQGFVVVDEQQRTKDERIFAIGDVAGGPMLAHKAFREGKVAAEVIAGEPSAFDVTAIPAVVFTDPQIAWCGLTEDQARKENRPVKIERFPWRFSSRATTMDVPEGLTKIITDKSTGRILGVGITGRSAEALISEGVLAVEMGALAEDVSLMIHPHPTFSETVGEAAAVFLGTATHMLPKQVKKSSPA